MTGGDLRYHLALKRTFTEEQTSMREMKLNNDDFRVFCSMHIYRIGIFAHKQYFASRYKTRKFGI